MSSTTSPYLEGNFAPVHEEVTAEDLEVTGSLPEELDGRYLRIGPNPIAPDPATYHWFMGSGMVHGVRLRDGRAEWYRNRWVRSADVAARLGEPSVEGPSTKGATFSPNTNVIGVDGRTFAIVEGGPKPFELDERLDTVGPCDFDGTLPNGYSAHPKVDPATGALHSVNYYWARPGVLEYTVVGPDALVVHHTEIAVPGSPMVHDMAITESHAVVFDLPVVFSLEDATSGASFPYAWDAAYGARLGVLPLGGDGDEVRWFEIDPCYVFHAMNAHDVTGADGHERVVLDLVRHDRVFDQHRLGPDEGLPTLWRYELDLVTGGVSATQLGATTQEFPRVDERRVGRPYRYGWATSVAPTGTGGVDFDGAELVCTDHSTGAEERHVFGSGRAAGEAVLVPRHADADEGDGYLLTFVYDAATGRSDLEVLAMADLSGDPVAVVHLPVRVPFGFHGNWVPS